MPLLHSCTLHDIVTDFHLLLQDHLFPATFQFYNAVQSAITFRLMPIRICSSAEVACHRARTHTGMAPVPASSTPTMWSPSDS